MGGPESLSRRFRVFRAILQSLKFKPTAFMVGVRRYERGMMFHSLTAGEQEELSCADKSYLRVYTM